MYVRCACHGTQIWPKFGACVQTVAESQICFHSWARIPARRLAREKQEAPHETDKSTRLLFVTFLSLSLSLSRNMHFLFFFSFSSLSSASAIVEIDELPGLAALQQRSHLGSRSAGDACRLSWVRQCCTYKQKSEWGKKRKTEKKNTKTGKGNCPPARESGVSRARSLKTRPHISTVILGNVWFWRHEFLWRHFSRSLCTRFYNISFRRCRPNFLVLQKEYKILVHILSTYKKLEQSTHWIIQKKWGKHFTFGSDCTVEVIL